ncbi:MAG: glycosyltransferase family 2 protein [Candidatus Accumulibacter sp.]|jgi:GT2 family glycosyltransferase|nr:glycosyltransferase family 2 protein [Accumulibacter sp.]
MFPITAIVVNYNAGALLLGCVESLLACEVDIVVVDNASVDESLDALPDSPRLRIIRNPLNLGFAAACNIGIKAALPEVSFFFFLNPDCRFEPEALAVLLEELRGGEGAHAGMAGGLLVNEDGSEQEGCRRAIPAPRRAFVRAFGLHRFSSLCPELCRDFHLHRQALPDKTIEIEAISGACMLVKREALEDAGLWDEAYFLHCEDLDLCMRFRKKGWKILFVPRARFDHALGACSHSRRLFVEWHKHKGMIRFYRKFFRREYPAALMWLVILGVGLRFTLVALRHFFRKCKAGAHG